MIFMMVLTLNKMLVKCLMIKWMLEFVWMAPFLGKAEDCGTGDVCYLCNY